MTGVVLPVSVAGSASGWTLVDYVTRQGRTEPASGDGAPLVFEFGQLGDGELWLIDHAVVACDSTTATSVRWYESAISDLALLDGSDRGNFDVADWPAGLHVRPSQSLVVVWSGASAGARGAVTVQARVLRR